MYRSIQSPLTVLDELVLSIDLDIINTAWTITYTEGSTISNASIVQAGSTDISVLDTNFIIEFDDSTTGDTYYGISAANAVGESDVVAIPSKITM